MRNSRAGLKARSPKISSSGVKRTRVPRFLDGWTCWIGPRTLPREKRWRSTRPSRADLDVQMFGQGVDDRDADAVQAARGLIGLAREFAARVQHGHDHLQRRLAGEFGVGIDRDAAAVVADRQIAVGVQIDGRSAWRGGQRPRPSHCRALRRTGGAARARRCRRYTCRAGGRGPSSPSSTSMPPEVRQGPERAQGRGRPRAVSPRRAWSARACELRVRHQKRRGRRPFT
jgi:hypothetical protein